MRVRVIIKPPIEPRHGVEVGQEYEVLREETPKQGKTRGQYLDTKYWIEGADGECALLIEEIEFVDGGSLCDACSEGMAADKAQTCEHCGGTYCEEHIGDLDHNCEDDRDACEGRHCPLEDDDDHGS